MLMNV